MTGTNKGLSPAEAAAVDQWLVALRAREIIAPPGLVEWEAEAMLTVALARQVEQDGTARTAQFLYLLAMRLRAAADQAEAAELTAAALRRAGLKMD